MGSKLNLGDSVVVVVVLQNGNFCFNLTMGYKDYREN